MTSPRKLCSEELIAFLDRELCRDVTDEILKYVVKSKIPVPDFTVTWIAENRRYERGSRRYGVYEDRVEIVVYWKELWRPWYMAKKKKVSRKMIRKFWREY
ncbi:hypothetical protein BNJ_00460 [Kaumoebavirus]|uniref:hypothetical protein n=1 Tax=Kaumoebavirus TaxID=1859492 RepID=UPI0009C1B7C6|nr:hypothetical protein BNJ_00460 [Kaumoebavirus]ARA72272.1 hypothetical protein BNJ_00460 [Kaumoebavirus]